MEGGKLSKLPFQSPDGLKEKWGFEEGLGEWPMSTKAALMMAAGNWHGMGSVTMQH